MKSYDEIKQAGTALFEGDAAAANAYQLGYQTAMVDMLTENVAELATRRRRRVVAPGTTGAGAPDGEE